MKRDREREEVDGEERERKRERGVREGGRIVRDLLIDSFPSTERLTRADNSHSSLALLEMFNPVDNIRLIDFLRYLGQQVDNFSVD